MLLLGIAVALAVAPSACDDDEGDNALADAAVIDANNEATADAASPDMGPAMPMGDAASSPVDVGAEVGQCGRVFCDCTARSPRGGAPVALHGRVRVVDFDPDFRVRVTEGGGDLRVRNVDAFAYACGEWEMVDLFPDFRIQLVDLDEDFSIELVELGPGLP